jgi:hypothetical protein
MVGIVVGRLGSKCHGVVGEKLGNFDMPTTNESGMKPRTKVAIRKNNLFKVPFNTCQHHIHRHTA